MAGRFLAGLIAGAVASGVSLGAVSLIAREAGPEEARHPLLLEVPAGSEFDQPSADRAARLPQTDAAPALGSAAAALADSADSGNPGAVVPGDTRPSARPTLGLVESDLSAPQIDDETSGMASEPEATLAEPAGPDGEPGRAVISDDPAQPDPPESESGAGFPSDAAAADSANAAALPSAPEAAMHTQSATQADETSASKANPRQGPFGAPSETVETGRLPSVTAELSEPLTSAAPTHRESPAIEAYAARFENPMDKPLMAIVLIDDAASPILLEALQGFPYPLTFALDASAPHSREAMQRYRAAGFEVLAIADLPAGADAQDTEAVMQSILASVPEAVAVLEGSKTGLQINRAASEQLAPILLESGHGLVLHAKGLQSAQKLIAREGVPVATIFRDFDTEAQDSTAIRRALDQAALRAVNAADGGVIIQGHLRADTIGALLLWSLQDRVGQVALAPVSAVLTASK